MSLVGAFLAQVERRADAPALVTPDGARISFAQLAQGARARARGLQAAGVTRGDAVLVAHGVGRALYETLIAIWRLGAVAVFPEPAAGLAGLRHAITMARPRALACGWKIALLRGVVRELATLPLAGSADAGSRRSDPGDGPMDAAPGDAPALITFTSGSTGRPKGIVRTGDFLLLQHRLLENLRRTSPDHTDMISLPVFILSNLAEGAASVIPAGRLTRPASLDGQVLRRQLAGAGCNRIIAPPAVIARICEAGGPVPALSAVFTGGGPVFPNLMRDMATAFPGAARHAVYGSTEAEPIAHLDLDDIGADDWSAMASGGGLLAGRPIPEIRVELVDHEVQVSGDHVNRGYLDPADDAATKQVRDGVLWHRTGDAARFDAGGRLWLLGRRDAASGGLFPFAVETAARGWPGVGQAALLVTGEGRARLFVSGRTLDVADLSRRAAALGDISVSVVPAIPMDRRHNSKVDYGRLRKLAR